MISTPKRSSVETVISIYGVETAPSTMTVESHSARGNAMSSPVTNCDESDPSTTTRPPRSGPHTSIGSLPPPSRTSTPSARRGGAIIDMGRCASVPSPLTVIGLSCSAAIGVNRRAARPDSPACNPSAQGANPPSIVSVSSSITFTCAPSASMHSMAACVSRHISMPRSVVRPSASNAAASARCA